MIFYSVRKRKPNGKELRFLVFTLGTKFRSLEQTQFEFEKQYSSSTLAARAESAS